MRFIEFNRTPITRSTHVRSCVIRAHAAVSDGRKGCVCTYTHTYGGSDVHPIFRCPYRIKAIGDTTGTTSHIATREQGELYCTKSLLVLIEFHLFEALLKFSTSFFFLKMVSKFAILALVLAALAALEIEARAVPVPAAGKFLKMCHFLVFYLNFSDNR